MAKKTNQDGLQDIESALTKTEKYIEENQKSLIIIASAIIIIVLGYLGYRNLLVKPAEQEAQNQMFMAEKYFAMDSFNLALNGDGNYLGFIDIIDEYGITKSANLAHYYAGISYLHLGEYEEAIDYLEQFSSEDTHITAIAMGAIGDAHMQMDNAKGAISFYLKAANHEKNNFTSPIYLVKAGETYEKTEQYDKAIELYQKIKKEFPESNEGKNIEKYITKAKISRKK